MPEGQRGLLSNADIERIVGRALCASLLAGADRVSAATLSQALSGSLPSTQGFEKERQEAVAIIECTDRHFLPVAMVARLEKYGDVKLCRRALPRSSNWSQHCNHVRSGFESLPRGL